MAKRPGTLTLRREDGRIVCERCTVADRAFRRIRGLLGRSRLKPGEGIVLRPGWSIHTGFMRFPIDVVFLDPDQTVIRVQAGLRPWKTASCRGAREVVELAAGECERRGLRVGDKVAWASTPAEAEGEETEEDEPHGPAPAVDARVVVASNDRRFAKLLRFLLSRHGIEASTSSREDLVEVIKRDRADVVVLDAPDSLLSAARSYADAKALYPDVTVLIVTEGGPGEAQTTLPVFDKWEGMNEVVETVGAAVGAPDGARA